MFNLLRPEVSCFVQLQEASDSRSGDESYDFFILQHHETIPLTLGHEFHRLHDGPVRMDTEGRRRWAHDFANETPRPEFCRERLNVLHCEHPENLPFTAYWKSTKSMHDKVLIDRVLHAHIRRQCHDAVDHDLANGHRRQRRDRKST